MSGTVATRRIRKRMVGPRGRTYYATERVAVPEPPPLNRITCDVLYDPETKRKMDAITPRDFERYVDYLREHPPADNRYFDPCTKRLLPNYESLVKRMREIKCMMYKEEGKRTTKKEGSLNLQLHQDIIVQGVREIENDDMRCLIGVLPRGGKTFIAGGLILDYFSHKLYADSVLWITAAPNETKLQVQKDLIEKFADFRDFQFVEVKETTQLKANQGKEKVIYFMSSQLLSLLSTGKVRHRPFLNRLLTSHGAIDMVFFDEAHKTGVGASTREQVEKLQSLNPRCPIIFLTATYFSLQKEYGIKKENTFLWDYTDVLSVRNLDSEDEIEQSKAYETLINRFGQSLVDDVLMRRRCQGESFTDMVKSYKDYPDLHFLSADFNPQALKEFEEAGIFTDDDGFDMGKLLQIRAGATLDKFKTKGGKILADAFEQFEDIDLVSDFIELVGAYILPRIDTISQRTGSRFLLRDNPSLMMFMPTGRKGTNIFFTLVAWGTALMAADWWNERYEVVCVVENETLPKDMVDVNNTTRTTQSSIHIVSKKVKETILELEHQAHSRGKGLIILAGEKLSMGVSLPFIDVVMMLNDKFASDDIIQKMYRAVTPSPGKKTAFIVDFTPERTLTAIYGYTKAASPERFEPAKILEILLNTYYWDVDIIPRNAGERNLLLAHRNTFQGSLRKLYHNAVGNTGEKKELLEGEIYRMYKQFLDQEKTKREGISVNYRNLTHPNNRAVLDPLQAIYVKKKNAINAVSESMRNNPSSSKARVIEALQANLHEFSKTFSNTIKETRKRRKVLNAAETKKVKKATVPTKAQAERLAEKERLKAEAAAAKAAAKAAAAAEKERLKAEAAAAKEAAKAAAAAEKARLKAEAAAARVTTGTRRKPRAAPAPPPPIEQQVADARQLLERVQRLGAALPRPPANGNETEPED